MHRYQIFLENHIIYKRRMLIWSAKPLKQSRADLPGKYQQQQHPTCLSFAVGTIKHTRDMIVWSETPLSWWVLLQVCILFCSTEKNSFFTAKFMATGVMMWFRSPLIWDWIVVEWMFDLLMVLFVGSNQEKMYYLNNIYFLSVSGITRQRHNISKLWGNEKWEDEENCGCPGWEALSDE